MTERRKSIFEAAGRPLRDYVPQLSVDCVVFGFHTRQLKVLLLKLPYQDVWSIPGGYVLQDETVEQAADRVLYERTGLKDVFLQQFRVFSAPDRNNFPPLKDIIRRSGYSREQTDWLDKRFVTVGFYALVDYTKAVPTPDAVSEQSAWSDVELPCSLMMDHRLILDTALEALRLQLNYQPIGMNLLPEKFTIPELQRLYEAILGKKLDRRNFQRKIQSYKILSDLNERISGVAHKAPSLYSFNKENYVRALKEGLNAGW